MKTSYKGKHTATFSHRGKLHMFAIGAGICLLLMLLLLFLDGALRRKKGRNPLCWRRQMKIL